MSMPRTEPQPWLRRGGVALLVLTVGALVASLVWRIRDDGHPAQHIDTLTRFLIAVAALLMLCHLLGALVARIGQPRVVGEILGGLLLGPSGLGFVWPDGQRWLFSGNVLDAISLAAQLGLAVFVFLLGCELRTEGERGPRKALVLVGFAMVLPFVGGLLLAFPAERFLAGTAPRPVYILFLGLALSITALPVLARVLVDLNLQHHRVGGLSLAAAAFGDGLAWAALTVILAATAGDSTRVVSTVALAAALLVVTQVLVRPGVAAYSRRLERRGADPQHVVPLLVAAAIGFAAITQFGGLHPIIGAFLFGTALPRESAVVRRLDEQLRGFAVTILLPLFFVSIGLTTQIGLLGGDAMAWLVVLAVLAVAMGTKLVGGTVGAYAAGLRGPDTYVVGALMNCRGVTELVVVSVGYQAHIIGDLGLTTLVLMALITTATTGPLVRWFQGRSVRQGPPESPVREVVPAQADGG
jgi:Kef-type K+ transport system membrane component KefB